MKMSGVVDRVVDGETAVVLVEEECLELNVPVDMLPEAAEEESWLSLEVEGKYVVSVEIDDETAEERRERIDEKMERLRDRGRESSERVE